VRDWLAFHDRHVDRQQILWRASVIILLRGSRRVARCSFALNVERRSTIRPERLRKRPSPD
jgi:hypothetical protein